jgi:hypothetical protein
VARAVKYGHQWSSLEELAAFAAYPASLSTLDEVMGVRDAECRDEANSVRPSRNSGNGFAVLGGGF